MHWKRCILKSLTDLILDNLEHMGLRESIAAATLTRLVMEAAERRHPAVVMATVTARTDGDKDAH